MSSNQIPVIACYDYLRTGRQTLQGSYVTEFFHGVVGLQRRSDYLFEEGESRRVTLRDDTVEKIIADELAGFAEDQGDFDTDVMLGLKPKGHIMQTVESSFYTAVLTSLKRFLGTRRLSHKDLLSCLADAGGAFDMGKPVSRGDYVAISRVRSIGEAVLMGLTIDAVTKILGVYEECAVLQSGSRRDLGRLKWNIRSCYEWYTDGVGKGIDMTGITFLREDELLRSEGRDPSSVRRQLDIFKLQSAYDEFRLKVAKAREGFDEGKAKVDVLGNFETWSFARFYERLSVEERRWHDIAVKTALEKVMDKFPHAKEPVTEFEKTLVL